MKSHIRLEIIHRDLACYSYNFLLILYIMIISFLQQSNTATARIVLSEHISVPSFKFC